MTEGASMTVAAVATARPLAVAMNRRRSVIGPASSPLFRPHSIPPWGGPVIGRDLDVRDRPGLRAAPGFYPVSPAVDGHSSLPSDELLVRALGDLIPRAHQGLEPRVG